jgi:Protein of unknown function (DUF1570)
VKRLVLLIVLAMFVAAAAPLARAEDGAMPAVADFPAVGEGRYQVFAQSGHQMAYEVNMFMNEMLRQYETYFNNDAFKSGARVVVFDNIPDFHRYATTALGTPHAWLAGYCQPKTDAAGNRSFELVVYQSPSLWSTLAHEGFHQFLDYELGRKIPVWLNEGMAQYFETSFYMGSTFNVGRVNRSKLLLAQILIHGGKAPPLKQMVQWTPQEFYDNADIAYPISWAFVYYLLKSDHDPTVALEFHRYLQAVKSGGDDFKTAQERLAQDCARWQSDFEDYILHLEAQTN